MDLTNGGEKFSPSVIIMDFGRAIKIGRAAAGLTQSRLASKAGLSASYLSLIESGKRSPSVATIKRLGEALGIPHHLFLILAAEPAELPAGQEKLFSDLAHALLKLLTENSARKTA